MRSILVIESNPELRGFVAELLLRAGHRVLATATARDAATRLAGARIDVVVTDLVLAARAPDEAFADLRAAHPELEIVALSDAAQSVGYLRLAAALGTARTLAQPFMSETLVDLTRPGWAQDSAGAATRRRPHRRRLPSRQGDPA